MKIVFHGSNAATFAEGIEAFLTGQHDIALVSDELDAEGEVARYQAADVIVSVYLKPGMPVSPGLKLFQAPSTGTDKIDLSVLPEATPLCNVFGHEDAIAEYVIAALLARHVPLAEADAKLRAGEWKYWSGAGPSGLRGELGSHSIGILGYGHIGKTIAARARAFGMQVHVCNRSSVEPEGLAATYPLDALPRMTAVVDYVVCTLPLLESTRGLVGAEAIGAMKPDAAIVNVGRGPVIDEQALYEALRDKRIGGAIIDTWYVYPSAEDPHPQPATLPFRDLGNVIMTPHMSGWTTGTIARRRAVVAENINRLARGEALLNRLR